MAYANGTDQQPTPPEPVVVECGGGYSVVWPQPQPPTEPSR
ncbi:hypothetical protein ACFC1T_16995 [Kitasatospora sp. NPDC056076]